jgi:hypothetical protein
MGGTVERMALGSKERTLDDLPFYQVVWKIAASFILMMPGLVLSDGGAFCRSIVLIATAGRRRN